MALRRDPQAFASWKPDALHALSAVYLQLTEALRSKEVREASPDSAEGLSWGVNHADAYLFDAEHMVLAGSAALPSFDSVEDAATHAGFLCSSKAPPRAVDMTFAKALRLPSSRFLLLAKLVLALNAEAVFQDTVAAFADAGGAVADKMKALFNEASHRQERRDASAVARQRAQVERTTRLLPRRRLPPVLGINPNTLAAFALSIATAQGAAWRRSFASVAAQSAEETQNAPGEAGATPSTPSGNTREEERAGETTGGACEEDAALSGFAAVSGEEGNRAAAAAEEARRAVAFYIQHFFVLEVFAAVWQWWDRKPFFFNQRQPIEQEDASAPVLPHEAFWNFAEKMARQETLRRRHRFGYYQTDDATPATRRGRGRGAARRSSSEGGGKRPRLQLGETRRVETEEPSSASADSSPEALEEARLSSVQEEGDGQNFLGSTDYKGFIPPAQESFSYAAATQLKADTKPLAFECDIRSEWFGEGGE